MNADTDVNNAQALAFVYPYGATLNVARPAVPVLSSGSVSFPLNRPVCALYSHGERGGGGRLAVVGSGTMFSDQGFSRIHCLDYFLKFSDPENVFIATY